MRIWVSYLKVLCQQMYRSVDIETLWLGAVKQVKQLSGKSKMVLTHGAFQKLVMHNVVKLIVNSNLLLTYTTFQPLTRFKYCQAKKAFTNNTYQLLAARFLATDFSKYCCANVILYRACSVWENSNTYIFTKLEYMLSLVKWASKKTQYATWSFSRINKHIIKRLLLLCFCFYFVTPCSLVHLINVGRCISRLHGWTVLSDVWNLPIQNLRKEINTPSHKQTYTWTGKQT